MTVQAEVIAAGASYFTQEALRDATGQPRLKADGKTKMTTLVRHEAKFGDVIPLSEHEFDRLAAEGVVQEPGSAPLPNSEGAPKYATPFSAPAIDSSTGDTIKWVGPIMGSPEPGAKVGGLTREEAEALTRQAHGDDGADEESEEVEAEIDMDESSSEEVAKFLDEHKPDVNATLDLARDEDGDFDPDLAEKLLEAELSREKPRSGVTDVLEKVE